MSYSGKFKDKNNNLHPVTSVLYGTCDTAAGTAAKVVTCADFDTLMTGVTIRVKFDNANTAASPTVNINSTGAKSVYRFGSTAPVDGDSWKAGEVVDLLYDGTSFFMVSADDIGSKQDALTFDDTPTDGSNNPVKSNGIYYALATKANTDMVAADFNAGTSYTAGNYCVQDGKLYKFKNNHSGAWSSADVDEVKITGELSALKSGLTSVSIYNSSHVYDEHGNINGNAFSSGSASIAITGKLATVSINFVTTKTGLDWVIQLKYAPETKVYFTAYVDNNRVTGYAEYLSDLKIWLVYIPNQAPNSVVSATFTYVLAN